MATAGAARPAPASSISPASVLSALPGVGPALISRLALLGISRPQDLLLHLPLRFEDRSRVQAIGSLREGQAALIRGRIEAAEMGRGAGARCW